MKDKHGNPVPLSKMIDVPPGWLLGGLILGWLISRIDPLPNFGSGLFRILGVVAFIDAIALFVWTARRFFGAKTPIHPRRKPSTLLTTGPFAISRNPIYLAMILLLLAFALWHGSVLGLAIPFLFGWIITERFIKGEEHFIEKEFGEEWRAYTAKVRRWL